MQSLAEQTSLRLELINRQNPDGGWAYRAGGSSWTEPTALGLLALAMEPESDAARVKARHWLLKSQQSDGGWAPQAGVSISTWVTSMATLALLGEDWNTGARDRALRWLRSQIKPPSSAVDRLLSRLTGGLVQPDVGLGTSWFPGTAAWLYPTAMAVLTFFRAESVTGSRLYGELARQGQNFILSRRCRDGGWNHGGSHFLSEDAFSYPEMTGVALLALKGIPEEELLYPMKRAEAFLGSPQSMEELCWLRLALAKHQRLVAAEPDRLLCRTSRDLSLRLLALNSTSPKNWLIAS